MKLVVYDLDHTLMPIDTGDIWCKWLLRACEKAVRVTAEETLDRFTREYIEQTLNIDEYEMWQMQFLAQFNRADLDAARKAYRAEVLEKILPASSVRIVNEAKQAGAVTAICSATYSYATQPSAELFGVDYLLSVRPQEDQSGNFTGRWIEPITYQQGKVTAVEKLVDELKRQGTTIDEYEFWSDSEADLALFEYVDKKGGRCCVVNARETLLRIASERGWHVQGGKLGKTLVENIKKSFPHLEIMAVGTNSAASDVMRRAGADRVATGENPVIVACRSAQIIVGPIGIAIADALMGEISPAMANAVASSNAYRVLIPMNLCSTYVAGVDKKSSAILDDAMAHIRLLLEGMENKP